MDEAPLEWFSNQFEAFSAGDSLSEQLTKMSQDPDKIMVLSKLPQFQTGKKEFKSNFKESLPDNKREVEKTKEAFLKLKDILQDWVKAEIMGHKTRKMYLEDIHDCILANQHLIDVLTRYSIQEIELFRLIGHISNLQLRILRKYFHDKTMKTGDYWDEARLFRIFSRYVRSWHHSSPEEKERRAVLLSAIKQSKTKSAVDIWLTTHPESSIPPYEDQNNRRPPDCQSLLLDPTKLDAYCPDWREITGLIVSSGGQPTGSEFLDQLHIRLQRLFDESMTASVLPFRRACRSQETKSILMDRLELHMSKMHSEQLFNLARKYYTECEQAAAGLWIEQDTGNLLSKCNRHPPHKGKVKHFHLSSLLRCEILESDLQAGNPAGIFIQFYRTAKYKGNRTLKKFAADCADAQKKYGISLKSMLQNPSEKDLKHLKENSAPVKALFNDFLLSNYGSEINADNEYAIVFIMSQLNNILEKEQHGFSNTCTHCSMENAVRSQLENGMTALAKRLPADSGRPFDGLVDRVVKRIAKRIATVKINQLALLPQDANKIIIPIIVEQNKFEFSLDLCDLKNRKGKKKNIESLLENQEKSWESRESRIKADAPGICPYIKNENKPVGESGQIDHIIPRAYSRKKFGGIINSEINLMSASLEGNRRKGERVLDFHDLNASYIQQVFNVATPQEAEQLIQDNIDSLLADRRNLAAARDLSYQHRQILRHALFLPNHRDDMINALITQRTARVNGTQKWLIKNIIREMNRLLDQSDLRHEIEYRVYGISAQDAHEIRKKIADLNPIYHKENTQNAISHVIDALCAFIAAKCSNTQVIDVDLFPMLLPHSLRIQTLARTPKLLKKQISSSPLYKDTIFGERFIPILIKKGSIRLGFDWKHAFPITKRQNEIQRLIPFLRWRGQEVRMSLNELIGLSMHCKSVIRLSMDKCKVTEFINRVFHQPDACAEDIDLAGNIEKLCYRTLKTDVLKAVKEQNKLKSSSKLLQDKSFLIKVENAFGINGKLVLPAKKHWEALLSELEYSKYEGQNASFIDSLGLNDKIRNYFHRNGMISNDRHRKTRQVFSLPVIAPASGTIFRIGRRGSESSRRVWQSLAANGSVSDGFRIDLNKPSFSKGKTSFPDFVLKSKHSHPAGEAGYKRDEISYPMDEWRQLEVPAQLSDITEKIWLKPGTQDRRYIRIEMTFEKFKNLMQEIFTDDELENNNPSSGLFLADRIKITKEGLKCFKQRFGCLLGTPRDKISLTNIGDIIQFEYEADGAPSDLASAYINGVPDNG